MTTITPAAAPDTLAARMSAAHDQHIPQHIARVYWLYRLALGVNRVLPRGPALAIAQRAAAWHGARSPRDRAAIRLNLEAIMARPVPASSPLIDEVFRHFASYLTEFFNAHRGSWDPVTIDGHEHLTQARRAGRGVIVLSAHLGNWELGGIVLGRLGFPIRAVAWSHPDLRVNRLFTAQRHRCGIDTIPLGPRAFSACVDTLQRRRLVGLVGDWALGTPSLEVTLCDRPALLPRGPAILSVRTGAPLLPTFLIREGAWTFRLIIAPPMWPSRSEPSPVRALTQRCADALTSAIRAYPTQWLMFHPLGQQP